MKEYQAMLDRRNNGMLGHVAKDSITPSSIEL